MTIQISVCEGCDCEDITGYVPCVGKQLCPECTGKYMPTDVIRLRIYMMEIQAKESEEKGGKIGI